MPGGGAPGRRRLGAAGRPGRRARPRRAGADAVLAASSWWRSWRPTTRPAWCSRWPTSSPPRAAAPRVRPSSPTPCKPLPSSIWPWSRPAPTWSRSVRTRWAARSAWARWPSTPTRRSRRASTAGARSASGAAGPRTWRVPWAWPPPCASPQPSGRRPPSGWRRSGIGWRPGCSTRCPRRTARCRRASPCSRATSTCACRASSARSCWWRSAPEGVCVSGGSSCASGALEPSHVLAAMGVPAELAQGALRFSLGSRTTDADVDRALSVVPAAVASLRIRA